MSKTIPHQEPEEFLSNSTGDGSQSPSREEGQGSQKRKSRTGASGPRTELGKRTSSRNAVKFGIPSRATLLKGESRAEYRSLLEGLWESWQPVGRFDETLVEKLAIIWWRYRRFLLAEGAEIRKESDFLDFDRRRNEQLEAEEEISRWRQVGDFGNGPPGLIWKSENPDICKLCLQLLDQLRKRIKVNGLDAKHDVPILMKIFGDPDVPHMARTLHYFYLYHLGAARLTEEERARGGHATPEQCKKNTLRDIDAEICRLILFLEKREPIESERMEVEILRQRVPDSRGLDRLLRYESSLERTFDRTLAQLERAQRIRKGQPLPPQLDVKIS